MTHRQSSAAPSAARRVVVIGAGIGGLAAAIDLARAGHEVAVLDRADTPGGKVREVAIANRRLDAGPTVFTMKWVFDELFEAAGSALSEHLVLQPLSTLARHAWRGDEHLDLFADIETSVRAIDAFSGAGEGDRYRAFCERAGAVYRTLETPFLRDSRPTPLSLATRVGWRGLGDLVRIEPFATLWASLGRSFRDQRLRQLFGRYATYCGSSPFAAPATLMLVAHVEQQGVWRVEGGMHRVVDALASLAGRLGATIRTGCDVNEIVVRDDRAVGVCFTTPDGRREYLAADAIVFNGDVAALGAGLLGDGARSAAPPVPESARSLSALTWNIVGRSDGFALLHHNVFFGADYGAEFDAIFRRGAVPDDPTAYVCAFDRDDAGALPDGSGRERLLCLVNAPPCGDRAPFTPSEVARCRRLLDTTLARCGLTIDASPHEVMATTPTDFAQRFPGSGGSLYGQASHGWAATFRRPGARSRIANLYLAGGTVHPGPGVPMAALSGRRAAASLLLDRARSRASTARSPTPATRGGMSTP